MGGKLAKAAAVRNRAFFVKAGDFASCRGFAIKPPGLLPIAPRMKPVECGERTLERVRKMGQAAISAAGLALLALAVSGCSMSSIRPGPASAAVASLAATPDAPEVVAAAEEAKAEDAEALSAVSAFAAPIVPAAVAIAPAPSSQMDNLIAHYATVYAVPESLVRRVIMRESRYNPAARNGPYYGLMQISHATAGTMGYRGAPSGLLDAETNLRYAVKYLAGAYLVAGGNEDQAVGFYARGYYYDAKRKGLLEETGLR